MVVVPFYLLILLLNCNQFINTIEVNGEFLNSNSQCKGTPNLLEPFKGEPKFVRSVENAALYSIESKTSTLHILHLYGTPFEMGLAHGLILKDKINEILIGFYQHVLQEAETKLPKIRANWLKYVEDKLVNGTLDAVFDLTYDLTKEFTPSRWEDELHGLSQGSGLDYRTIRNIHMLPEVIKAGCSMLGAWSKATTDPDNLFQLRALDWDTDGGLQLFPLVTVYHPTKEFGHTFAILNWPGFIGGLSGMSSAGLAISEIGADIPFGKEERYGYPFHYLLRDILQYDTSLQSATRRMQSTNRTCSIWVGVGDRNELTFNIFQYSYSTIIPFSDTTMASIEPRRMEREHCEGDCVKNFFAKDIAYWGIHLGCWQEVIHKHLNNINVATIQSMIGQVQTGNLHAAIYDHNRNLMYVGNALPDKGKKMLTSGNAYDQQFFTLNMTEIFSQKWIN